MPAIIRLRDASLCVNCDTVVAADGETCPSCHGRGGLMSLASVLNRAQQSECEMVLALLNLEHLG